MIKFFSIFLFSILPIYSCNQYLKSPVCNSFNGDINIQIRVKGIGMEETIHRGSLNFLVTPDKITIVNLDLSPEHLILGSNFYPFKNRINKCEHNIDFEKASFPDFQKLTLFDDAVFMTYDYLTYSNSTERILHNNLMTVYGNFSGRIMKIPIMRCFTGLVC